MTYDVDYFIRKFEVIPEDMWLEGSFDDGERKCANGHCGMEGCDQESKKANALYAALSPP